jgi:hypothetical protein
MPQLVEKLVVAGAVLALAVGAGLTLHSMLAIAHERRSKDERSLPPHRSA